MMEIDEIFRLGWNQQLESFHLQLVLQLRGGFPSMGWLAWRGPHGSLVTVVGDDVSPTEETPQKRIFQII